MVNCAKKDWFRRKADPKKASKTNSGKTIETKNGKNRQSAKCVLVRGKRLKLKNFNFLT